MKTEKKEFLDFYYEQIAERIITLRKKKGFTQEELALEINADVKTITVAEQNRRTKNNPYLLSETTIEELLKVFNVTRKWLLFGDEIEQKELVDCLFEKEEKSLNEEIKNADDKINYKPTIELSDSQRLFHNNKDSIYRHMIVFFTEISRDDIKQIDYDIRIKAKELLKECLLKRHYTEMEKNIKDSFLEKVQASVFRMINKKK